MSYVPRILGWCVFVLVLLFATRLHAQPSMTFGVVTLRLGMTKEEVRSLLVPHFHITESDVGSLNIWQKGAPPFHSVGAVLFSNGKAFWMRKDWGHEYGRDVVRITDALVDLLKHLSANQKAVALITVQEHPPSPGGRSRTLEITIENRKASLSVFDNPPHLGGPQVDVNEQIMR